MWMKKKRKTLHLNGADTAKPARYNRERESLRYEFEVTRDVLR